MQTSRMAHRALLHVQDVEGPLQVTKPTVHWFQEGYTHDRTTSTTQRTEGLREGVDEIGQRGVPLARAVHLHIRTRNDKIMTWLQQRAQRDQHPGVNGSIGQQPCNHGATMQSTHAKPIKYAATHKQQTQSEAESKPNSQTCAQWSTASCSEPPASASNRSRSPADILTCSLAD